MSFENNGDCGGDPMKKFMDAIIPDLPLIMHGSGDVIPSQVDPGTTSLLAELVSRYVYDLVQAAVDAHDVLTDGAGGLLPPPPPKCDVSTEDDFHSRKRPRQMEKRKQDDDWEEDLPIPKIAKMNAKGVSEGAQMQFSSKIVGDPRISSLPMSHESSLSWQGVKGVNLFPDRIRKYYVTTPTAIGTQCFIYPISHDAQLYNRVKNLLDEQKDFSDVMLNQAVVECAEEESDSILGNAVFGWVGLGLDAGKDGGRRKDNSGGVAEDGIHGDSGIGNEGSASTEADDKRQTLAKSLGLEMQWPGFEELLPTHHET